MSKELLRGNPAAENVRFNGLVGVPGVEPGTSSLSGTRSNQLSYTPNWAWEHGGGSGIRTRDFQLAKLALCQLSYAPGSPASNRKRQGKFQTSRVRRARSRDRTIVRIRPSGARAPSGGFSLERR